MANGPAVEQYRKGYPRYSALISAHEPWFVFRRFKRLRARLLLLKQDRLSSLEAKLDSIDENETRPLYLGVSRVDRNEERWQILSEIDTHMASYGMLYRTKPLVA